MPCMTEGNHGGCCDCNRRYIIHSLCDNLVKILFSAVKQSHADILYMNKKLVPLKVCFGQLSCVGKSRNQLIFIMFGK